MSENLLTIGELMCRWKCSRSYIYTQINVGKLKPLKLHGLVRFSPEDVLACERGEEA